MLQQKTEQTAEWLNTTTVSLAGTEVGQAVAALPSTDPQSSGGNKSIIIWPAAAPSGYPVSQQDANAQESHRLGATSSLCLLTASDPEHSQHSRIQETTKGWP